MKKKIILIIDDDRNNIREVKDVLEPLNYEVIFAEDGESGLEKLKHNIPDLILLDLVLPGQSGFKVAQEVKSNPAYKHIPIIAISLKKENIDKYVAVKIGATEYIEKPINFEKLIYTIRDLIKD